MICIIDLGYGNISSINKMLTKLGYKPIISNRPEDIKNASKLILPGVGSFDNAMNNLDTLNLLDVLSHEVLINKKHILGICLGMQIMFDKSEEGLLPGLGWISGEVVKFHADSVNKKLKYPNIGWREVEFKKNNFYKKDKDRFYFVHNFYCKPYFKDEIFMNSFYGQFFCAAVIKENIIGVQFHPEKSHQFGMSFFTKFLDYESNSSFTD
jgi:glutamine amidotransferase